MDKEIARKVYVMIDSGLIWYKHYYFWCDAIIEKLEKPPLWIMELALVKFIGDAKRIVNEYAFSFEEMAFPDEDDLIRYNEYHLACLYLRYKRREISWATFLNEAGKYSDVNDFGVNCEFFFEMLTDFEDSLFSIDLERAQSNEIDCLIKNAITDISDLYNEFHRYFIKYVENETNKSS